MIIIFNNLFSPFIQHRAQSFLLWGIWICGVGAIELQTPTLQPGLHCLCKSTKSIFSFPLFQKKASESRELWFTRYAAQAQPSYEARKRSPRKGASSPQTLNQHKQFRARENRLLHATPSAGLHCPTQASGLGMARDNGTASLPHRAVSVEGCLCQPPSASDHALQNVLTPAMRQASTAWDGPRNQSSSPAHSTAFSK